MDAGLIYNGRYWRSIGNRVRPDRIVPVTHELCQGFMKKAAGDDKTIMNSVLVGMLEIILMTATEKTMAATI